MTLIGPDQKAILAERKSLLVVAGDYILKLFEREFKPSPARRFNQLLHRRPAGLVEAETDLLGLMPQHKAEKFTDPDCAIIHAISKLSQTAFSNQISAPEFGTVPRASGC